MDEQAEAKPVILVGTEDIEFYFFLDHVLEAEALTTHLADSLEAVPRVAGERVPRGGLPRLPRARHTGGAALHSAESG